MEYDPKASAAAARMAAFAAAVSADAAGEAARRAQANAQGLASEILSAEALNSLAESAPRLVRAVAEGLGITPGGLRQMADQGALTSEVLVVAFQKKAQDLQQEDRDRMAEIDAKAQAYGFSRADVLRALDAAGMPKFAAGDMLAQVPPGEAIVPKAFNPWDGGQASGERLESRVSQAMEEIRGWSAAAFRSAALQPESDEAGRRFIEHGAMCYANCFLRIQRALGAALTPP
ncbi:MAG: tape measure protein [Delftia acidovorans]|nr:tape measure protein [Delftia acidovorans]